ncbi:MAG: site-specific integrase [Methyloversatilis sp.]|jgi:integrase|uniref:tyrosine-type recombinase/integrase n=1 Tax=Methyloversatilis sp. TaxID=2569862 RepID=UPI0025FA06C5|nr:site-specific integrase [Methyloversatilis sp.]MCR6667794.1 site-specific integrase [Methyloversatilis sp.]
MATPYLEGSTWSVRLRIKGHDVYMSGYASAREARIAAEQKSVELRSGYTPIHGGPKRHTVAQAMYLYALERLPFIKGARQEASRINAYLLQAKLGRISVERIKPKRECRDESSGPFFEVRYVPSVEQPIPPGLHAHRESLSEKAQHTRQAIRRLAALSMAQVTPRDVQDLIDARLRDGFKAATAKQEQSQLLSLFEHAIRVWQWHGLSGNPASETGLRMPPIDNAREETLTQGEYERLIAHINADPKHVRNRFVLPSLNFLLETAMRSGEAFETILWRDLDRERKILFLTDAKELSRTVPLSPGAMQAIEDIERLCRERGLPMGDDDPLIPITHAAMSKAWNRWCKGAGVENVTLHDLRHTAATRYAKELGGDVNVLSVITGHKTLSQLGRYVNQRAEDVARALHGEEEIDESLLPAGLRTKGQKTTLTSIAQLGKDDGGPDGTEDERRRETESAAASNVIHAQFGLRREVA